MGRRKRDGYVFCPQYESLPEKSEGLIGLEEWKRQRHEKKKKNLENFHISMWEILSSSFDSGRYELEDVEEVSTLHKFHPDFVKVHKKGVEYGEVKVTAFRQAKFWCSGAQLDNYGRALVERLEKKDDTPRVNYIFIRMGKRDDYEMFKCSRYGKITKGERHVCGNGCLTENLCSKIRDVSIIPLNLLIALLSLPEYSYSADMQHKSSNGNVNQIEYHNLLAKYMTRLHGEGLSSEPIFDGIDNKLENLLNINKLRKETRNSPDNLWCFDNESCSHHKIERFPVVGFKWKTKKEEKEWLNSFHQNYDFIMEKIGRMPLEDESFDVSEFCDDEF